MTDILDIADAPVFDERIVKYEMHAYNPYANTSLGYSDEIRIPIQQQDLYTLPCESFLYIEGKVTNNKKDDGAVASELGNNCVAFMFDEIRYELNGVEIDRNRNAGITTTIKNYISLTSAKGRELKHASWSPKMPLTYNDENFNFCVPLNILLGFCEDYKRIVMNARHELILIRSRNDNNCLIGQGTPKIELFKIQWRMPHIALSEVDKLSLLRTLDSGTYLSMAFRSWDLYEFPLLQNTTKHSWAVKTASQLEKPRFVIFALQTGRKSSLAANAAEFDHCKLTNVRLHLNSDFYPYDDLNLDFDKYRFAVLYNMYTRFRKAYYGCTDTYMNIDDFFEKGPFVVIDCSRQNEAVKSATVDVRIEFDCKENIPANTTAYCLILHDRMVEYNPLNNVVRRIV